MTPCYHFISFLYKTNKRLCCQHKWNMDINRAINNAEKVNWLKVGFWPWLVKSGLERKRWLLQKLYSILQIFTYPLLPLHLQSKYKGHSACSILFFFKWYYLYLLTIWLPFKYKTKRTLEMISGKAVLINATSILVFTFSWDWHLAVKLHLNTSEKEWHLKCQERVDLDQIPPRFTWI